MADIRGAIFTRRLKEDYWSNRYYVIGLCDSSQERYKYWPQKDVKIITIEYAHYIALSDYFIPAESLQTG